MDNKIRDMNISAAVFASEVLMYNTFENMTVQLVSLIRGDYTPHGLMVAGKSCMTHTALTAKVYCAGQQRLVAGFPRDHAPSSSP